MKFLAIFFVLSMTFGALATDLNQSPIEESLNEWCWQGRYLSSGVIPNSGGAVRIQLVMNNELGSESILAAECDRNSPLVDLCETGIKFDKVVTLCGRTRSREPQTGQYQSVTAITFDALPVKQASTTH